MVFTGKPSKACGRCRQRRLKCDFTKPSCRKCQAAQVECPGYRNEQDMLFRNVTDQVIVKHMKKSAHRKANSRSSPSIAAPLQDGVLEVSLAFLFRCYLRGSSFSWAEALYQEQKDPIYTEVVKATALGAFSHECHRPRLLSMAAKTYDNALLQLRDHLTLPIADTTLAAVLLMSRFEALLIDSKSTTVTENWTKHILGAFSILQSRTDKENFEKPLSYQLAEQICHNYNVYCIQQSEQREATLAVQYRRLFAWAPHHHIDTLRLLRLRLQEFCENLLQWRLRIRNLKVSNLEAVESVLDMDQPLTDYENELAAVSSFEIVSVRDLAEQGISFDFETHGEKVHFYKNQQEARLWNSLRMLKLTLHADIVVRAGYGTTDHSMSESEAARLKAILEKSYCKVLQTCADICASAPAFLRAESPDCTHSAASYLTWPIFCTAKAHPEGCREFVKEALLWISRELNIKSAGIAAENLDEIDTDDDGLLACYMF